MPLHLPLAIRRFGSRRWWAALIASIALMFAALSLEKDRVARSVFEMLPAFEKLLGAESWPPRLPGLVCEPSENRSAICVTSMGSWEVTVLTTSSGKRLIAMRRADFWTFWRACYTYNAILPPLEQWLGSAGMIDPCAYEDHRYISEVHRIRGIAVTVGGGPVSPARFSDEGLEVVIELMRE